MLNSPPKLCAPVSERHFFSISHRRPPCALSGQQEYDTTYFCFFQDEAYSVIYW